MAAEILAPAGSFEALTAAVRCGANAVYLGGKALNARRNAANFSDEELNEYLEGSEWQDKAGGYAIQGHFGKYIEKIEGDYDNVVGFPWTRIEKELESF